MPRARRRAVSHLPLLPVLLAACWLGTEPDFPSGAVPLEPPAPYRLWWDLTQQCSGLTGEFSQVRWYVLPGAGELPSGHHGYWYGAGNRIVLAEAHVLAGGLVRHEMLHALLRGEGAHSASYFRDRCGGYVACVGECAAEVGPPPLPGPEAPVVEVRELEVTLAVAPAAPSRASDGGWVALVVTARNPRPAAVWVRLVPIAPGHPAATTFGYTGDGLREYSFVWDSLAGFGPGAVQREVFDLQLWRDKVEVRGHFNADTTAPVSIRLAP
jgi:hypothetical protein